MEEPHSAHFIIFFFSRKILNTMYWQKKRRRVTKNRRHLRLPYPGRFYCPLFFYFHSEARLLLKRICTEWTNSLLAPVAFLTLASSTLASWPASLKSGILYPFFFGNFQPLRIYFFFFRTTWHGNRVMQVGGWGEEWNAEGNVIVTIRYWTFIWNSFQMGMR